MGPRKAGPGAGRQHCGDHIPSFCSGAAPRTRGRHHGVRAQDVPPEATDAVAPSSPARRGAITSGGAHEAQPLRGHHGRSVQSITARTAHVYSAGAESRVALPPPPTPLPHP
jgi:hypothetical protein